MERTSGNSMIDNKIGFVLYCERKATEEEKHGKQRLIKMSSLPLHDMALHRDCVTQWIASLIVHSAMMTMTKIPDNRKADLTVAFIHLHYNWDPLTKTYKATTVKKKKSWHVLYSLLGRCCWAGTYTERVQGFKVYVSGFKRKRIWDRTHVPLGPPNGMTRSARSK